MKEVLMNDRTTKDLNLLKHALEERQQVSTKRSKNGNKVLNHDETSRQ